MKIIITENQNRSLLTESISSNIDGSLKKMKSFSKDIIDKTSEQTGLDFGFLLSWGATLGGLMMPVSQFIEGKHPELSSLDLSLLLTGAMVTFYSANKKTLSKILDLIKERGLVDIFNEVLENTSKLKDTFLSFVDSLNLTIGKLTNMLAYTFLIPILPTLYEMANSGYDQKIINEVVIRLLSYGVIVGSSIIVKEILKKIIDRFRS